MERYGSGLAIDYTLAYHKASMEASVMIPQVAHLESPILDRRFVHTF